ncbi:MAG: hypothetical protein M3O28_04945 [Actinomycetota bacterium]|nr:hypothetical protein [Actinomycetota bacterium]
MAMIVVEACVPVPTGGAARATELLGVELADIISEVDDAACSRLADQIDAACARQLQLIDDAVNAAIRGVPLPVRGLVKKALLG